ncbi:MAG: HIT family protein [Gammaproteobacteria bacterium]|nr:HIT family protein [Gammaproteobacteria bacterium]
MADNLNLDTQALNATMLKFGAPDSCIYHYQHWLVMLRPQQATLGALVLAALEPVKAFSDLSAASFAELGQVTVDIETCLKKTFDYDKLNYLMLMMVDPDVHFHVIPRYADKKVFEGVEFEDKAWPGPPDLACKNETSEAMNQKITDFLPANWK